MEDTGSLSVFENCDVKVKRRDREPAQYRLTPNTPGDIVYIRKWEWGQLSPSCGEAIGLGSNPIVRFNPGHHIPAAALEQLREHILAFYREATGEKALAHV